MGVNELPLDGEGAVGGDLDAFPSLGPEFIECFSALVDAYKNEFDAFFVLLGDVHSGTRSADLIMHFWDTLSQQCLEFEHAVDSLCGRPDRSPFSAFVHFCFHEIRNLIALLITMVVEIGELGAQFDASFEPNRVHVQNYFELLRQGQPALEYLNLQSALQDMAQQRYARLHVMPSYDPETQVRLAPAALSAVLDNLQRGANQVNGGGAAIHLVLDSGVDEAGQPWVHLNFLSDVHDTSLTPERFAELLMRRPDMSQRGGLGLHLSELLLQAQRRRTNVFGRRRRGEPRTPPCLQFRQAESSAPLVERDREIISGLSLPTDFLFTIDLTDMRAHSKEERFDCAFDGAVQEVFPGKPEEVDPLLPYFIEYVREEVFRLYCQDGELDAVLEEIPSDDVELRLDFSRLVSELDQRLDRVVAA